MLFKKSFIQKIEEKLGLKKSNSDDFESLKNEVISILKKQAEKEHSEVKKALRKMDNSYTYLEKSLEGKIIQKAGYPVGTIREWKGKKYIKIAPKMWKRKYDKNDRGASISAGKLIKQVEKCENTEQLLQLVLANKQRFSDENGKPLPIVDKIRAAVNRKNDELSDKKGEYVSDTKTQTVRGQNSVQDEIDKQDKKKYGITLSPYVSRKRLNELENDIKDMSTNEARSHLIKVMNNAQTQLKRLSTQQMKAPQRNVVAFNEKIAEYNKTELAARQLLDSIVAKEKTQQKKTPKKETEKENKEESRFASKNDLPKEEKDKNLQKLRDSDVKMIERNKALIKKYNSKIEEDERGLDFPKDMSNEDKIEWIKNKIQLLKNQIEYNDYESWTLAHKESAEKTFRKNTKEINQYKEDLKFYETEAEKHANRSEGMKGNQNARKDGVSEELIENLKRDLPDAEMSLTDRDFIEKEWAENKNYVIRKFKEDAKIAKNEADSAKEKGIKDVFEYQKMQNRYYNYIASNLNHIPVEKQINGRMGIVYKQIEKDPMLAAEFLIQKHSGYIENVFSYKINGIQQDVGISFGNSNYGLKKQIEKHIIEQTDFESVEEMMKKIDNVLKFGKENNKNQKEDRIRVEHNNYAVILSIDEDYGNVFISSFKKIYPKEQVRTRQEQKKKMEEISNRHPNFFNQEGSLVPETTSTNYSSTQSENSQSKKPTSTLSDVRKKYESSKSVQGNKKTVTLPNGEKIKCHYKLVEADAPTATHNENTFAPVEALTKNGQTINDRDYAHDKDAQESVISIAQKYGGQALSNPPIVTKDGVVVSGNNRTMSSKLAAKNGTDKAYLDDLKEQIDEFGIDEDELKNFKHPRIVLEMDNEHEGEYTTQEMAKYNESGMKTQNTTEKAVKLAKTLTTDSITDIADSISGYETLGELYNDEDAVNNFVGKLVKNGILTNQNKSEYVTDGKLSDAGKEFVETVLCGTILNESNIRQMNSEGGRNIRKKLIRALMPLAQNKGNGKEYSINDELNKAVEIALRVAKNHKETPDVNSYMQQQDMFDTEKPSELTVKFAEFVHDLGEKNFADKMKSLQAGLRESANGSQDIFLGGCETKDEVINRIFELKKSIQRVLTSLFSVIN